MRPKLATDMHNSYRPKKCQNTNFLQIFRSAVHFLSFHPAEVTHTRYVLHIAKIIICLLQTRRGIIIVPVIFYSNAGVCYSSLTLWTLFHLPNKKKSWHVCCTNRAQDSYKVFPWLGGRPKILPRFSPWKMWKMRQGQTEKSEERKHLHHLLWYAWTA